MAKRAQQWGWNSWTPPICSVIAVNETMSRSPIVQRQHVTYAPFVYNDGTKHFHCFPDCGYEGKGVAAPLKVGSNRIADNFMRLPSKAREL